MSGGFWDKVTDFIDEPVVQCDVPAVKNTSLVDVDSDDCRYVLMVLFNVLFVELILSITSVS